MPRFRFHPGGGVLVAVVLGALSSCAKGTEDDPLGGDGGAPLVDAGEGGVVLPPAGDGGPGVGDARADAPAGGCTGKVVINEVLVGSVASANEEFVELFNPNDCEVPLDGLTLEYKAKSGNSGPQLAAFASTAKIAPRGYFVAGTPDFKGTKQAAMTPGMAGDGASVALIDGAGKTVDAVGWGVATAGYIEGSPAPAPPPGDTIARKTDGVDTDDNRADFAVEPTPTPGAAN